MMVVSLSSCSYDYNWPDLWVQQSFTITSDIDVISILSNHGYDVASIDTKVTYFAENGDTIQTFKYTSTQDKIYPPRECSYFNVSYDCFGWMKGYHKDKEQVCLIVSNPLYINNIQDSHVIITEDDIKEITYYVKAAYKIYVSNKLPLEQWANDYGYDLWGSYAYYTLYDENETPIDGVRHKYNAADYIMCEAGQLIQYEVEGLYRKSYGDIRVLYTVIFDKFPINKIVEYEPFTNLHPFVFNTSNAFEINYYTTKK